VNDTFLVAILLLMLWINWRGRCRSMANIFTTLVTIIVALRHLGVAQGATLHHDYGFSSRGNFVLRYLCLIQTYQVFGAVPRAI
jgi:hypothetical protein